MRAGDLPEAAVINLLVLLKEVSIEHRPHSILSLLARSHTSRSPSGFYRLSDLVALLVRSDTWRLLRHSGLLRRISTHNSTRPSSRPCSLGALLPRGHSFPACRVGSCAPCVGPFAAAPACTTLPTHAHSYRTHRHGPFHSPLIPSRRGANCSSCACGMSDSATLVPARSWLATRIECTPVAEAQAQLPAGRTVPGIDIVFRTAGVFGNLALPS
jgi:hypothetical protein